MTTGGWRTTLLAQATGPRWYVTPRSLRDARSVGTAQRWLSRLSWVLGQNADSERYAAAAVSTLETLGPGPELAMAYSNLAQLRMLADDNADALHWGRRRRPAASARIADHPGQRPARGGRAGRQTRS
jgi:hypothetical protein